MRRSHVEARSRTYAPRQYVSETHDHKPDAPARRHVTAPRQAGKTLLGERMAAALKGKSD